MKISKIKIIHGFEWKDTNYGKVCYHDIEMENGDRGSIGKKKENAFTVGQELEYEIKPGKYEGKFIIKEAEKPNEKGGNNYQQRNYKADFISFAMSYAKDVIVGEGGEGGVIDKADGIIDLADVMFDWMCAKYDGLNKQTPQATAPQKTETATSELTKSDISPAQITLIKTLWGKTKITDDKMRAFMLEAYSVESTTELTKTNASNFIDRLNDSAWVRVMEEVKTPTTADYDLSF